MKELVIIGAILLGSIGQGMSKNMDILNQDEFKLLIEVLNQSTDACIPEEEDFRRLQQHIVKIWTEAEGNDERYVPHEYMYKLLLSGVLEQYYEIDSKDTI